MSYIAKVMEWLICVIYGWLNGWTVRMDGWMIITWLWQQRYSEGLNVRCVICIRDGSAVKTIFQTSLQKKVLLDSCLYFVALNTNFVYESFIVWKSTKGNVQFRPWKGMYCLKRGIVRCVAPVNVIMVYVYCQSSKHQGKFVVHV